MSFELAPAIQKIRELKENVEVEYQKLLLSLIDIQKLKDLWEEVES